MLFSNVEAGFLLGIRVFVFAAFVFAAFVFDAFVFAAFAFDAFAFAAFVGWNCDCWPCWL